MSIFETLADLQKATEKEETGGKREFLTLKSGEQVRVRFRQELAKDSSGYDEDLGTARVVTVHSHPGDFKKKLACTIEEKEFNFRCWACEQRMANKKWGGIQHLLINVAVEENGVWVNKILDQKFSKNQIGLRLVEYASEYGSIVDRDYKFSRIGSGMNDTQYNLIPLAVKDADDEVAALEAYDLSTVYRKMDYDEQVEYFNSTEDKPAAKDW